MKFIPSVEKSFPMPILLSKSSGNTFHKLIRSDLTIGPFYVQNRLIKQRGSFYTYTFLTPSVHSDTGHSQSFFLYMCVCLSEEMVIWFI